MKRPINPFSNLRDAAVTAALVLCCSLMGTSAFAVDDQTLPAGVRNVQVRYGVISGLSQTWGSDGNLYDLGQTHSISFDAQTLSKVNPQAQALVQALNYFGNQDLGSKINLGTLNVSTSPQITYAAPVFAYGITDRWTIGFGVPVIHYTNHMSLSAGSSNLDFYRSQFSGISAPLDAALNVDLVQEAQKVLAEKGYRPLSDRDEQFVGDTEVMAIHKLDDLGSWSILHQVTLYLPTGPKDDPNDLEALNQFGRTQIENTLIAGRTLYGHVTFLPYTSLLVPLPDTVSRRVPTDENDTLPDASQTQSVQRWIAPTISIGGQLRWNFLTNWDLKTGAESAWKGQDTYSGSGRMDLLSVNSDTSGSKVMGGFGYSTIESFRHGAALIPARVSLEVSDTVLGRNIPRELITEVSAMIFF